MVRGFSKPREWPLAPTPVVGLADFGTTRSSSGWSRERTGYEPAVTLDGSASGRVMLGGFIEVKRTFHSTTITPSTTRLATMVEPEPGR
jgi:hypothetical protein